MRISSESLGQRVTDPEPSIFTTAFLRSQVGAVEIARAADVNIELGSLSGDDDFTGAVDVGLEAIGGELFDDVVARSGDAQFEVSGRQCAGFYASGAVDADSIEIFDGQVELDPRTEVQV